MEKQILLKNILKDLSEPDATIANKKEAFDWDIFVNELMDNRQEQNQNRMNKVEMFSKD